MFKQQFLSLKRYVICEQQYLLYKRFKCYYTINKRDKSKQKARRDCSIWSTLNQVKQDSKSQNYVWVCMSFSDPECGFHSGWVLKEEDSRKIIKKALDQGINFLTPQIFTAQVLVRKLQDVPFVTLPNVKMWSLQRNYSLEMGMEMEEIQQNCLVRLSFIKLKKV